MLLGDLQNQNESTLKALCKDSCPESVTLDFKREAPKPDDKGKHEFLKDVCALTNSEGGDLVYGIAEKNGAAEDIYPIFGEEPDAMIRRLSQILDAGIEPRIRGARFRSIPVQGGNVLVLRIPPSLDGPHRYLFNGHSKFVMRTHTHTTELSYDQLRQAFDRRATFAEQVRRFKDHRLQKIIERRTPKPIISGPLCALHVIPMSSMANLTTLDLQGLNKDGFLKLMGNGWGGASRLLNLDGLLVHSGGRRDTELEAYTQLFRTGAIEGVSYCGSSFKANSLPSTIISAFFRDSSLQFIRFLKEYKFFGPAVVSAALLNVENHHLSVHSNLSFRGTAADREHIILPETWIENIENIENPDLIIRPLLDILWQAFDIERCYLYDADGKWTPR